MAFLIIFLLGTNYSLPSGQIDEKAVRQLMLYDESWFKISITYLGVQLMEDVFKIVALNGLFGVEQVEEFLDELRGHIDLEGAYFHGFVDEELEEELVDALEVGPGWVHFFLLVDTRFRKVQIALLDVGKRSENVLFNHLHDLVQIWNDHRHYVFLVL